MSSLILKRFAITGCCGTIGRALLRVLSSRSDVEEILAMDNNESGLFALEHSMASPKVQFAFGDVRDEKRLRELFTGIDVVLHTAALKHVSPCEFSPNEAIKTNIDGVQNVIAAARANNIGHVAFTSSDKAVNPTNVMGTTKLMGERLITAAQIARSGRGGQNETVFVSTRFGNVLGSHGSVFPLFCNQIARGGPVTLTDPAMTRFVMNTDEAVDIVLRGVHLAIGGEVFVSKMRTLRIEDLAHVMIAELAPRYGHDPASMKVHCIGKKPGEKLYEELLTEEECQRSVEMADCFAILPAFREFYATRRYEYADRLSDTPPPAYASHQQPPMTRAEIVAYLTASGLLDPANIEGNLA